MTLGDQSVKYVHFDENDHKYLKNHRYEHWIEGLAAYSGDWGMGAGHYAFGIDTTLIEDILIYGSLILLHIHHDNNPVGGNVSRAEGIIMEFENKSDLVRMRDLLNRVLEDIER